jgi:hypothetical protein
MDHEELLDHYLNGACPAFIQAVWLANGKPDDLMVGILSADDHEPVSDEVPFDFTHLYIDGPDYEMDIAGKRPVDEMADDLHLVGWEINGPWPYAEIMGFVGSEPGHDLPLSAYPDDVERALAYIQSRPDDFRL